MTRQVFANAAGVIILISVIIAVSACIDLTGQQGGYEESRIKINESQAIEIVKQDPVAMEYMSGNFKRLDLRGNKTTLVQGFETNNSALQEDETYWKVEMMERTCACSGINLAFKDVVKNTIRQPNQCMTYQNINPPAADLPTFP